jgi:hypothetical protein
MSKLFIIMVSTPANCGTTAVVPDSSLCILNSNMCPLTMVGLCGSSLSSQGCRSASVAGFICIPVEVRQQTGSNRAASVKMCQAYVGVQQAA